MARVTPRVERTCLCCEAIFEGTPRSTRCNSCKEAGHRVPSRKQTIRRAELRELKGEREATDFELQLEAALEDEIEDRETRRLRLRQERVQRQLEWLDYRSKKPKGYKAMNKATGKKPIGQLWRSLCQADGQINCLTRDSEVTVEDRERLLLIHFGLRLKGFSAAAIAQLCPEGLLAHEPEAIQAGLASLPQVEPEAPPEEHHDQTDGLTDQQRDDLAEFLDAQERQRLSEQLAL